MSTDGFISMLSLADLYFFTENSDGEYTYRFQWSTQAVKAAVDGVFNPNINDYDDEEDYYSTKALYDYVSANKNDGTDQADSFIFRIYEKDTGALVKEIATSGTSVDITDLDGEYLWEVSALKNGAVIKTSDKAFFTTDHAPCYQAGINDDAFDNRDYDDLFTGSSANHSLGTISSTASSYGNKQGIIISHGHNHSNFFACGEWDDSYDWENRLNPYELAQQGGYLFSISNFTDRIKHHFPLTENCMYGMCGLYVYNEGKWDYIAYSSKAKTGYNTAAGDFFFLDNEMIAGANSRTVYRYNTVTQKIETLATSQTPLWGISPSGTHYMSYNGIYRINDNKKVVSIADEDGEYLLFDNVGAHLYFESNGTISEELDDDESGKTKVTYYHFNNGTAGNVQTFTLYEKNSGVSVESVDDELFSIKIGDYICYKIDQRDENYSSMGVISIVHKIENGTVTEVSRKVFENAESLYRHYINKNGDLVASWYYWDEETQESVHKEDVLVEGLIVVDTMSGSKYGLSWTEDKLNGKGQIISIANAAGTISFQVGSDKIGVDFYGLPGGDWQCSRQGIGQEEKNHVSFTAASTAGTQKYASQANGDTDLFFAKADGKWSGRYAAEHHGALNDWSGTKEQINLTGKNKIADVFSGSSDANILVLTDDANGDALFVEDIYTSFGKDAARFLQIDEIRAGNGDDIIDMTSQMYAYDGEEMTIRGGLGDDVIWAVGGDNDLFGDAGNDRIIGSSGFDLIVGGAGNDSMHSGGGNDIFAFCENWGVDTVEITDNAYITLWFASGNASNWDAEKRVYRDGSNSVTVIGGANSTIDLKFGNAGGQYSDMLDVGAFESAASEKIFEDKDSGMLA